MATISANGANGHHKFTLTVTEGSINIENNTSPVSFTFKISSLGGTYDFYQWGSTISFTITINGTTYTGTIPDYDGDSTVTLKSGTLNVAHNTDGSKSISISFSVTDTAGMYYTPGNASASGTMALTTIPRASSFGTITGNTIGGGITVNITRNSSSFTHSLWYSFGTKTWQSIGTGIGTSKTFTPPMSLCSEIPSSTSGTFTLILRTYSGSTQIGSDVYKTFTIYVPSSIVPSAPTISHSEAVSGLASKFAAYVKGKSKLSVSLSASGIYGSTIKSYATEILGSTYSGSSFTSGILNSNGTVKIKTTVIDSRGRTASNEISITVIDYSNPYISLFNVERCNSDGTLNDDGVYIKATFTCGISSVGNKNDKTIKIQYQSGSSWVDLVTYSEYSKSNATYVSTVTFTTDSSFNFRLYVADYFINVTSPDNISTGFTLININADVNGIAFGKVSEDNNFDVGLPAIFRQDVTFNGYVKKAYAQSIGGAETVGWYKIATFYPSSIGSSYLICLGRNYHYSNSESYTILINTAYTTGNIKILSSQVNGQVFTKLALVMESNKSTFKLYAYYNANVYNGCHVTIMADSTDEGHTCTTNNFASETITETVLHQIDTDYSPYPVSLTYGEDGTYGIYSVASSHKSMLGAVYDNGNTYYNIISTRHRNGSADGDKYGMVMCSEMLNDGGHMYWRKQINGTWGIERCFLDSVNYINYTYSKADIDEKLVSSPLLWSGSASFMTGDQSVNLSQAVSAQKTGIVLVWSYYGSSAAQNYDWNYTFISKRHISNHAASGINCTCSVSNTSGTFTGVNKYIFLRDTKISGYTGNSASTASRYLVLRYVYGF